MMKRLLLFLARLTVLAVTLGAVIGVQFVRCAHTGKIRFAEFSESNGCQQGEDDCMEHIFARITDSFNVSSILTTDAPHPLVLAVPAPIIPAFVFSGDCLSVRYFPDIGKDPPNIHLRKLTILRA